MCLAGPGGRRVRPARQKTAEDVTKRRTKVGTEVGQTEHLARVAVGSFPGESWLEFERRTR
jgi:hypothetical protein